MTGLVADITAAIDEVATIGPFFAVSTEPAERADHIWRPLVKLHTDSALWRRRIAEVRQALHADEHRVAASLAFQSLAARLVSPPLALAARHGVVPSLTPAGLFWRQTTTGPWPMWVAAPVAGQLADTPAQAAGLISELVIERLVLPVLPAVRAVSPVAGRLLLGNVASSLAGAAVVLAGARAGTGGRARSIVRALLAVSPLAGTGAYRRSGPFRRTSCCLYYRTPDGGLCGDCPFDAAPAR